MDPPSKSSGEKNKNLNTTHGTEAGGKYGSDDDFDSYELLFAKVGISIVTDYPNIITDGSSEGELNLKELEHTFDRMIVQYQMSG